MNEKQATTGARAAAPIRIDLWPQWVAHGIYMHISRIVISRFAPS